jgi:CRISPR system Cascade subunit CasC
MNFLNFHVLQTLPFSNLNRDDAGSPKAVIYGGTNRARLSSQALKRAARTQFETGSKADKTTRTKFAADHLEELVVQLLDSTELELTEERLAAVAKLAHSETRKLTNKETKDSAAAKKEGKDDSGDTLVWLAEAELHELAERIARSVLDTEASVTFDGWVQSATSSLTIAGFGRMFAAAPGVQTEAAIQVAHAFTTHATVTEIDYFTAVDDEREKRTGDHGSGHLDLAEFTSGVFYRYFNIDRDTLAANWRDEHEPTASGRLGSLIRALLLSLPSGKANSTAPLTLPSLVMVQQSAWPVSYADSFEAAVSEQGSGFAANSRTRLLDYQRRAAATMPSLFGEMIILDLTAESSANLDEVTDFSTAWLLNTAGDAEG